MKERTNPEWLHELNLEPPKCNAAIQELRNRLHKGLVYAFSDRPGVDEEFLEDHVQEATIRILDRLYTFRGESRFLTWANKIAVRLVLTELRKRRWSDVSLDSFPDPDSMFPSAMEGPEDRTVRMQMMSILGETIRKDLTEKQRLAMTAVRFNGMPLEEVALRMGTNRNSLYKLLHDARLRLKEALTEKGVTVEDLMEAFR